MTLRTRLSGLASHGLLNQFGYQRFGSGLVPTDTLGLAVAQGQIKAFYGLLCANDYYVRRGFEGLGYVEDEYDRIRYRICRLGESLKDSEALAFVLDFAERVRA